MVITGPVMYILSVGGEASPCASAHSRESVEYVGSGDGMRFAKSRDAYAEEDGQRSVVKEGLG